MFKHLRMLKILWNALKLGSVTLSTTLGLASSILASEIPAAKITPSNMLAVTDQPNASVEQDNPYSPESHILAQMTSVSQLSDVNSSDWAFQALQSLIEHYDCIVGYSDRTYGGDQTLTRYEFAAALETCLNQMNKLIAAGTVEIVNQEDFTTLERLQSEFAAELGNLRGRINNLEARGSLLAAQQFSTTTTLRGEAIFAIIGANGEEKADDSGDQVEENIVFGSRLRLGFETSFTGKDSLFARLQGRNIPGFDDATGTSMARLGFEGSNDNSIELDALQYSFLVGEQLIVYLNAQADADRFINVLNPLLNSGGRGSISRFGRRNPLYRQVGNAGIGIDYNFSKFASLGLGYLANNAEEPSSGLFNGAYGAIAQLILKPSEALDLGLTYVHSYNNLDTGTGSELANEPFDEDTEALTANSYGIEVDFRISPAFSLGGWVGYTQAIAEDLPERPAADIFNYAIILAFPDLGGEGNLAGIVVGQPPKVTNNELGKDFSDRDTSLHLEVFYRLQATDNIFITPGLFIITNPEHNESNDTIYLGLVRTTFRF